MKLAEALLERADLKQKLILLNNRLVNNAKIQEGLKPNEEPKDLLKELEENLDRMEYLIIHINKTNERTKNKEGKTISELIARRDVLNEKLKILGSFVNSGSLLVNRLTHSEIKILPSFSVSNTQKQVDKISAEIRRIDTAIQEMNWTTELI